MLYPMTDHPTTYEPTFRVRIGAVDRAIALATDDALRSISEHWDLSCVWTRDGFERAVRSWARDSLADGQPLAVVVGLIREGV